MTETGLPSDAGPRQSPPSASEADAGTGFGATAQLNMPSGLRPGERLPLLLFLHGFGVSSALLVQKAGLGDLAARKRFAYLAPEGERDALGRPFWNAGPSCCDLEHRRPNDAERLSALLDAHRNDSGIDPRRIFVIGYSNGGFMAQRLACDSGALLAGVVSVAGAAPAAGIPCSQSRALSFLEIHGDEDPIVHYAGGTVFDRTDVAPHASALDTAKFWATQLECQGPPREVETIDLEPFIPERETRVSRYDGCHGAVELWTVRGGGHYVALQTAAVEAIWAFITAHPKR